MADPSQFSTDVVAVYDSNLNQVIMNARPLRAQVREPSLIADHPLETGQIVSDYMVILPVEITLPVIVDAVNYQDTYQEIKTLFTTAETLTIKTRSGVYENMVILDPSHDETPEFFDVLTMQLRFRQVLVVDPNANFDPSDATQGDTVARGQQSGTQASDPQITGVATSSGTQTLTLNPNSSIISGGAISGVATSNGTQTIPLSNNNQGTSVVNGVATMNTYQGSNALTGLAQ